MSAIVVPIVWNLARGVLWVACTSTRLSVNTIVLSVSTAAAAVRMYKTVEQAVDVIIVVQSLLHADRVKKTK